jgi:site-specific DNA-methyltransferase (adenine-specific)
MLDQILGENQFQNEIVWLRTSSHNDSRRGYGTLSDSLFFYTGTAGHTFNVQFQPYSDEYIKNNFRFKDETGRYYSSENLRSPNPRANLTYEYKGFKPHGNGWTVSREKMEQLDRDGRLIFPKTPEGRIRVKKYLDEMKGVPVGNVWTDIPQLSSQSSERLGYPTQKPLALLDRIINASSNPGDIVLDAFCGCGTAIVSAQNLKRRWIGIDVSPTACRVMAKRLRDDCRLIEGKDFVVRDLPRSEEQLRKIPPFEFENWAVIALGGIKNKVQVGDMGIDGKIYPAHSTPAAKKDALQFMDVWYPIQVKQKDKAGRPDIDSFEAAMMRENRAKGFFVSFAFSRDALTEIDAFFRREGRMIIPLTVREILDEEIAQKLA